MLTLFFLQKSDNQDAWVDSFLVEMENKKIEIYDEESALIADKLDFIQLESIVKEYSASVHVKTIIYCSVSDPANIKNFKIGNVTIDYMWRYKNKTCGGLSGCEN